MKSVCRVSCVAVVLGFSLSAFTPLSAGERIDPASAEVKDGVAWHDVRVLGVEGQGWADTAAPFDRLPGRAEKLVRASVWGLSRQSAGLAVRFETDATEIHASWKLRSARLAMNHMAATGVSGLDLYVKVDSQWRWLAVGRPTQQENTARLVSGIPPGRREFMLYLPLYNGVDSVSLGLPAKATLWKAAPRKSGLKPIVFYGTSITQGGCASRTGMVHTAILGRWLDAPVINLGFSGNGRMENEVATLMAELDVSVYVLDCLPNIGPDDVTARTEPVVKILREAHPDTPIVLVEDRSYADSFLVTSKRDRNESSRAALKAAFDRLKAAGDDNLYYIEGEDLMGNDSEGTVDSSHPTDLGFFRQAEVFQKVLRPILDRQKSS